MFHCHKETVLGHCKFDPRDFQWNIISCRLVAMIKFETLNVLRVFKSNYVQTRKTVSFSTMLLVLFALTTDMILRVSIIERKASEARNMRMLQAPTEFGGLQGARSPHPRPEPQRNLQRMRTLIKVLGSKEHLDWVKIDLNVTKIITAKCYKYKNLLKMWMDVCIYTVKSNSQWGHIWVYVMTTQNGQNHKILNLGLQKSTHFPGKLIRTPRVQ